MFVLPLGMLLKRNPILLVLIIIPLIINSLTKKCLASDIDHVLETISYEQKLTSSALIYLMYLLALGAH